tara:strand:- start:2535 stop:2660 length:126 start_codon:yes stop_codon:yes gene_type:complete
MGETKTKKELLDKIRQLKSKNRLTINDKLQVQKLQQKLDEL